MQTQQNWPTSAVPIVICGPTAAGKTDAALTLARRQGLDIISADSVQVYRFLNIGSAKPDISDISRVPVRLVDIRDPDEEYSVSGWKQDAEAEIERCAESGRRAIVCGGTGLYIRALLSRWSLAGTARDPDIREALRTESEIYGSHHLHSRLASVDPVLASRLHPNDSLRIIRALEVFAVTGQRLSALQERDANSARAAIRFGIYAPKEVLYTRIDKRVDDMIDRGLVAEVESLLSRGYGPDLRPMQSLGYREMCAYLNGETTLDQAIALMKQNTRRYAKRQMTWFRSEPSITWFDVSESSSESVADRLHDALMREPA